MRSKIITIVAVIDNVNEKSRVRQRTCPESGDCSIGAHHDQHAAPYCNGNLDMHMQRRQELTTSSSFSDRGNGF